MFGDFTVDRNTAVWVRGSAGLLVEAPIDFPAFEFNPDGSYKGFIPSPSVLVNGLHSRDLTQAEWVATNVTPAKTATGADGGANLATTLTATGANGTVLQAITSASAERVFSAYVRRRTGVGVVEITQDGTTWTPMTLTTQFLRFETSAQTIANPSIGFRIVTSGDAIDVDFTQAELNSEPTPAIVTTTVAITTDGCDTTLPVSTGLIKNNTGAIQFEFDAGDSFNLFINGLEATVSGVVKVKFEYSPTTINLYVDDVLEDTATGSYSFSTLDSSAFEFGHDGGLDQPNIHFRYLAFL